MMRKGNFSYTKKRIELLCNPETFYEDVRKLVGYYEHPPVDWEDWEIKNLQRVADNRYNELTKE